MRASVGVVVCVACVLTALLSGCSTGGQPEFDQAGPWAAQFEQEYEVAHSDYVRGILEDGVIETMELRDARQHVVACMADAGYVLEYVPGGFGFDHDRLVVSHPDGVAFSQAEQDAQLDVYGQCRLEWMGLIDTLYQYVQLNPDNQDWDELVAACLVRRGVVEEGFTVEDYRDLQAEYWAGEPSGPMVLPGGKTMRDPDADHCARAPLQ